MAKLIDAQSYDALHQAEEQEKIKILIDEYPAFNPLPGQFLLDIGCGTGISMSQWNCEKMGVDPNHEMLAIAQENGLTAIQAHPESLPFSDGTFDFILSVTALHLADNPEKCLKEFLRIAKSGAIIALSILASSKRAGEWAALLSSIADQSFSALNDVFYVFQKK